MAEPETDGGLKLVMHQIEHLIQGLLASQAYERSEVQERRPSQLGLPAPRRPSQGAVVPQTVPELPSCPSSPRTPDTPKANPKILHPQVSKVSLASHASLCSRQVTPSDEGSVSAAVEDFSSFRLRAAWAKRNQEQGTYRLNKLNSQTHSAALPIVRTNQQARCTLDWRVLWASAAAALILFDCVSIPLLAFSVQEPWVFDLIRIIFWSLSLPKIWSLGGCSLRSARNVADGVLEVALVALIFGSFVQGSKGLSLYTQFLLRGPELLRLRYFPKLYGYQGLPRWLIRWNRGELRRLEMRFAANIACTLVACMVGIHLLTCAWFAAGQAQDGWAVTGGLMDRSVLEQYRTTLEWAISRIPPSQTTENVLLATQLERGIALTATAVALLAASIFTSIVTNDMSDIRRVQRQQGQAECQLSDFLETFPVSRALELQLKGYLKQTVMRVSLPGKREMATLLPDLLHGQLCSEGLGAILARHGMLASMMMKYPSFQRDLCVKGLEDWTVAPDEILFSEGLSCQNMLFVAFNIVLYKRQGVVTPTERTAPEKAKTWTLRHGSSWNSAVVPTSKKPVAAVNTNPALRIKPGHWLCEPCLWTEWHYMGQAVAGSCTTLLCLNHTQLLSITAGHADISAELVIHARLFLNALNELPEEELSDVQHIL